VENTSTGHRSSFYHGCGDDTGHYLFEEGRGRLCAVNANIPSDFPVCLHILDAGLLPPNLPQEEGLATVAYVNGWTILAFWDRSVDKRGNSNSAFVLPGQILNFATVLRLSRERFPWVFERIKFDVRER
jgi:hypothetical protein